MTGEMVKQVCDFYLDSKLESKFNRDKIRDMCVKTKEFIDQGRTEKAMRWLGFIQGVLWCDSIYTIDEMRAHNTGEWIMIAGDRYVPAKDIIV